MFGRIGNGRWRETAHMPDPLSPEQWSEGWVRCMYLARFALECALPGTWHDI